MRVRNMYNMQECIVETIQKDDKGELLLKVSMNDISETCLLYTSDAAEE